MSLKYLVIIILFCLVGSVDAQTKIGHKIKRSNKLPKSVKIEVSIAEVEKLKREDELSESKIKPTRFAKLIDINSNLLENGTASLSEDGEFMLYEIQIEAPKAHSLFLKFDDFYIPNNCELMVYNSNNEGLVLTSKRNNKLNKHTTIPISGDFVTVSYAQPIDLKERARINISQIGYDYTGYGSSLYCNVDVNCSEGDAWKNESSSVCRITVDNSYCTGSLINNSNNDGKPYVLSAEHCFKKASHASSALFIFNYESPSCNGSNGTVVSYISGSTLIASWTESDFALLELSTMVPNDFNVYWNGWDKNNVFPTYPVVSIHHPAGDVKKISKETLQFGTNNYFWLVDDWDVGTVQGGSSGAPLFNAENKIIGQVSGGNKIFCNSDEESWHGKLSSSWNGGGTSSTRLRDWLDSSNTLSTLGGLRYLTGAITSANETSGENVKMHNTTISSNITINCDESLKITGTFSAPVGNTLKITP